MRSPRFRLAVLLLPALAACREDSTSPTGPAPAAVSTAAVLVFDQVSTGVEHACGVDTDGKAWCWGANEFGELGIPPEDSPFPCSSRPCSLSPVAVSGGLRFQHVVAGGQFTCGITTGDEVFCWGRNDIGQLGTGSSAGASSTPAEIAGNRRYRQVRAGLRECGLRDRYRRAMRTAGGVVRWGMARFAAVCRSGSVISWSGPSSAWAGPTPAASPLPTKPGAGEGTSRDSSATARPPGAEGRPGRPRVSPWLR